LTVRNHVRGAIHANSKSIKDFDNYIHNNDESEDSGNEGLNGAASAGESDSKERGTGRNIYNGWMSLKITTEAKGRECLEDDKEDEEVVNFAINEHGGPRGDFLHMRREGRAMKSRMVES
jgi:hypothetical protein